jgi:predicted signal transduction protein with EAL and GGDEF domain
MLRLSWRLLRRSIDRRLGRLQVRAALVVGLVLLLFAAAMVTADIVSTRAAIHREIETQTESTARIVAAVAADKLSSGYLTDMTGIVVSLARIGNVARIEVHDRRSGVTLEADDARSLLRHDIDNALAREVLLTGSVGVRQVGATFEVAAPILMSDAVHGVVLVVSSDALQSMRTTQAIARSILIAGLFLLVLSPLLVGAVGRLIQPIRDLTRATRRVAEGALDVPVIVHGRDEIADLARSFRRMTSRLHAAAVEERRLAYVDPVTGLANRARIHRAIDHAVESAPRDDVCRSLLFIDLDGFKRVNDVFGHDVGDKLLAAVAQRFRDVTERLGYLLADPLEMAQLAPTPRRVATIGRQGGDEFIIVARFGENARGEATQLAEAILGQFVSPFLIDGQAVEVGASIGVAFAGGDGADSRTLMRNADLAMYEAKQAGRGCFRFFSQDMSQRMLDRLALEMELRRAIACDEIEAFYMPQVDLATGKVTRFEALARWRHPTKGLLQPASFIPIAEETGLISQIDRIVLRKALRQASEWAWTGTAMPIAVNLSPQDFGRADIVGTIKRVLLENDVPGDLLEIEITESAAMDHSDHASTVMNELKRAGVRFAIDDFGTGYSNLSQLLKIPVDAFKIDRSFVAAIETNGEAYHLVRTIVGLAGYLGLDTVAEGIETEEQADVLARMGVKLGQGYYYGAPMEAAMATQLIEKSFGNAAANAWMV